MSFGGSSQLPALPAAPPPPPNPPMFGANSAGGKRQRAKAAQGTGYSGTILGGAEPASTSNKTLLGQ